MWNRRELAQLLLGAGLVTRAAAQAPTGSTAPQSRRSEVEALRKFAESRHPRGREAAADKDWRARWEQLAAHAEQLTDGAYFVGLRQALGWFRDGHTTVLPFEFTGGVPPALARGPFARSLPLRVRAFHDGAWVVEAAAHARELLGARLTSVGKLDAAQLIRNFAAHWPGNDAWAHRWSAAPFSSPALLQALGASDDADGAVSFQAQAEERAVRVSLAPHAASARPALQKVPRKETEYEEWARSAGGGNFVRALLPRGALYVSVDEMGNLEGKSFEFLTREVFEAMETPAMRRLIVDLRRNGGGNNYLGEALRKRLERSAFNRPGGLYVLIGPRTFSAAQNLATRLERETFATFIGEASGGAPNHYGDAAQFRGEATGITAIVSTLPWFDSYPQDTRPWILPDLPVPERFADWRAGRDPALQAALTHETRAAPDDLDRSRIFYFKRDSQKQDWRPFWRA